MMDLSVSDFDNWFGCRNGDCLFEGQIVFPSAPSDLILGTPQAARDSFVFTKLPEPASASLLVAALATIAALRAAKSRSALLGNAP